jgi:hypothetical protein
MSPVIFTRSRLKVGLFYPCNTNLLIPISTDQAETVSRRIEKFADLMQSIWVSRNDYERRVRAVRDKLLN